MNNEELIDVKTLRPFRRFIYTIGALPSSYLISMTYEEQLIWFCNYLEKTVIPAIDNNGLAVEELQAKYIELKDYVDHYFDNLDIQEEINNKLDEMAESGELTDIIAQYLQLAGVLAYNTLDDLENAENVVNGSICMILGKDTYNDGKTAYYKIRNILNTDVIDGDELVAITNNNQLVGEKIHNYYIDKLLDDMSLINNKKFILIGDSYAEGYTPDGNVTSWAVTFKNLLGLSNENCIIKYLGGTGFCKSVNDRNFITLLDEVSADNNVTDIIVCGGYNDTGYSDDNINAAIGSFKTLANTKFPNAKIHIGFIGWTTNAANILNLSIACRQYGVHSKIKGIHFLKNCQYTLHNYSYFSSDGVHPNSTGSYSLGCNILQSYLYGSCDVIGDYNNIHLKNINSAISSQTLSSTLGNQLNNNIVQVSSQGHSEIEFTTAQSLNGGNGLYCKIGDIDFSYITYIIGDNYQICKCYTPVIIRDTNYNYYNASGYIFFSGGSVYIKVEPLINDAHNNYLSTSINQIQILEGIIGTFDSNLC